MPDIERDTLRDMVERLGMPAVLTKLGEIASSTSENLVAAGYPDIATGWRNTAVLINRATLAAVKGGSY